ncbi:hypothetical protein [Cloacibacillus sp. An23]|uniref:hypothetical protein n=1 Tax=Cloacibacillus sp. An23 TaxID=1965591 RepID=UPI000B39034F|nr:hypothetical protein [Cloacibacillus sp. An23]OUO94705.1 hypothetical protein B5F39_02225 [Cloacibacillus sp. An23]
MATGDLTDLNKEFAQFIKEKPAESREETPLYSFKPAIAVYIDLLGIKKQIYDSIHNKDVSSFIQKMEQIKDIFLDETQRIKNVTRLYISDSFICICPAYEIKALIKRLARFQFRVLTECHNLLRGAIEYGDVTVEDEGKQIIGPAYIEAYLHQEHDVVFPRIVLGESVLKLLDDSKVDKSQLLFSSIDGEQSIDFIQCYALEEKVYADDIRQLFYETGTLHYLNTEIKNYKKNMHVRSKYVWTKNYLIEKGVK